MSSGRLKVPRDTIAILADTIRRMTMAKADDKLCSLITLNHTQGTIHRPLERVIVTPGNPLDSRSIAEMFFGIAEAHAEGLDENEIQRYTILAYLADSNEPFSNQSFRIDIDTGVTSLVPTEKGMTHQHMRLVEACFKISTHQSEVLLAAQYKMLSRVMEQNEKLIEESADVMDIFKTIIMEKATDEQAKLIEAKKYDRNTKLIEKAMQLGPPLVNQITGKKVFPEGAADTALLESFAESITEEQAAKLASTLSAEQAALLFGRFEEILRKKRENAEKMNGITVKSS